MESGNAQLLNGRPLDVVDHHHPLASPSLVSQTDLVAPLPQSANGPNDLSSRDVVVYSDVFNRVDGRVSDAVDRRDERSDHGRQRSVER